MTNPFSVIAFVAAATGVALLGAIGRRPAAYNYVGQHHTHKPRRMSVPLLKASMSWRVRSAGVEQPVEPLPEEPTVSLNGNAVVALGQLAARQQLKTTPTVIEHETGIGILKPVVDGEPDDDGCDSVSDDNYQCEVKGDHDTCSACDGEFTWPREAALAVASV